MISTWSDIRAVSPQSGRYVDPSIKDKKVKDIKLEKRAENRKERLLSRKIRHEDIQNLVIHMSIRGK